MERLKQTFTSKIRTPSTTPHQVTQQIHYLRKIEEYNQTNESLRQRVKLMEQELSKKNANRPLQIGLTQLLAQLVKKNTKLQSELSKTVHRQNQALAQIKVRKQTIKLARNERVIHSGIFKNIEKQIKNKEDMYKNLLIKKRLESLSTLRLQQDYAKRIKILENKLQQTQKSIANTKQRKQQVIECLQKQKQSFIMRNSVLQPKQNNVSSPKQSIYAIRYQDSMTEKVLSEYALVQIQEMKLLQITNKDTLQEAVEVMKSVDNSEILEKIQTIIQRISEAENQLKQVVRNVPDHQDIQSQKQQLEDIDYKLKKQLITKINKQKQLISQMTKKACEIAARSGVQTNNMSDFEIFQAIESFVLKQPVLDMPATTRSNDSTKLTQLLLKSKRSKDYEQLISENRFKELYSNFHVSPQ